MIDIVAIAALMQHDALAPNAPTKPSGDFAAVLAQKRHESLASLAQNDAGMQRESLQARLEHGASEIHKESANGIAAINTTKAVVGLVNQDLWRQTFSPAIHMAETAEVDSMPPTLDSPTDNAPVLATPLFETDKI
ncbi:MAG: hypothetical protein HDT11_00525 [Helicobacter sp.]|nr:hypothetical protein [Helicobacter sp.]MBD5167371.1 hypothetical protein [Helicobacter sp.]MDE5816293.1 hypothetical protein [Helicobacter sp.]MDE7195731.1 hypothetical protein [Helicobacter sp.]